MTEFAGDAIRKLFGSLGIVSTDVFIEEVPKEVPANNAEWENTLQLSFPAEMGVNGNESLAMQSSFWA